MDPGVHVAEQFPVGPLNAREIRDSERFRLFWPFTRKLAEATALGKARNPALAQTISADEKGLEIIEKKVVPLDNDFVDRTFERGHSERSD